MGEPARFDCCRHILADIKKAELLIQSKHMEDVHTIHKKISFNKMMAITGTVIALSSLLLGVWQGYQTDRQNQAAIEPYLGYEIVFRKDGYSSIGIVNLGSGAAVILAEKIYVDDKLLSQGIFDAAKSASSQLGIVIAPTHTYSVGAAIPAGENGSDELFHVRTSNENELNSFTNVLSGRLKIEIDYASISGKTYGPLIIPTKPL